MMQNINEHNNYNSLASAIALDRVILILENKKALTEEEVLMFPWMKRKLKELRDNYFTQGINGLTNDNTTKEQGSDPTNNGS